MGRCNALVSLTRISSGNEAPAFPGQVALPHPLPVLGGSVDRTNSKTPLATALGGFTRQGGSVVESFLSGVSPKFNQIRGEARRNVGLNLKH